MTLQDNCQEEACAALCGGERTPTHPISITRAMQLQRCKTLIYQRWRSQTRKMHASQSTNFISYNANRATHCLTVVLQWGGRAPRPNLLECSTQLTRLICTTFPLCTADGTGVHVGNTVFEIAQHSILHETLKSPATLLCRPGRHCRRSRPEKQAEFRKGPAPSNRLDTSHKYRIPKMSRPLVMSGSSVRVCDYDASMSMKRSFLCVCMHTVQDRRDQLKFETDLAR